jgi:hypothetical protein
MEMLGEEKKIQALFSQLRLDDEQTVPSFAATWGRAQSKTYRRQGAFNLSFVAATALLVCALVSLALWSRQWERSHSASVANVPATPSVGPVRVVAERRITNPPQPVQKGTVSSPKSRALKLAARREALLAAANRQATHEAQAIASWQSPTATLLDSPSDELLKSLPQLNQTVDELKSFLPNQPK